MPSQYRHRRTSNPATAFPNPLEPGEIAVNTANRQIAVGDALSGGTLGAPLALVAVRFFDARAQYAAGDIVVQAGAIYRAKATISPGAFNATQWDTIAGVGAFVAKTGDTMTGALTLPGNPGAALEAAPKQYVDAVTTAFQAADTAMNASLSADIANRVRYDAAQTLTAAQQEQARVNIAATPWDAMSYSGLQTNGNCEVYQLGTQSFTAGGGGWPADGWQAVFSPAANKWECGLGGLYPMGGLPLAVYMQNQTTGLTLGVNDHVSLLNNVEGYRWGRMAFGRANPVPVTISFLVAVPIAGTMTLSVRNGDGSRTYLKNIALVASWQYVSVTVPPCTDGTWDTSYGTGALICFNFGCGTNLQGTDGVWQSANKIGTPATTNFLTTLNSAVYMSGLTIMPGSYGPPQAKVPYVLRPYSQELVLCQRYFTRESPMAYIEAVSVGVGASNMTLVWKWAQTMRTTPTVDISSLTWSLGGCNAPTIYGSNATGTILTYGINVGAGGRVYAVYNGGAISASARI